MNLELSGLKQVDGRVKDASVSLDPAQDDRVPGTTLELEHQLGNAAHREAGLGERDHPEFVEFQLGDRFSETFRILFGGQYRDVEDLRGLHNPARV